jgi:predicted benzoate:H+ symporter BenE
VRIREHLIWGTVIIVFSAISFLGMGGFFIGSILGIVGGALALSLKPEPVK